MDMPPVKPPIKIPEPPKPQQPKQGLVYTHPKSMRFKANRPSFWAAIIGFVLAAAIFSVGVYFYQDYFYSQQIQNLQERIVGIQEGVDILVRLSDLRSGEGMTEDTGCPDLEINESMGTVYMAGSPLDFTQVRSDEEEIWEIIDATMDSDCERVAWSTITTFPKNGSTNSQIFVADIEGSSVDVYELYQKATRINFEFFKADKIVYSYHPIGYVDGNWWNELSKPTALLDISTELVDEWGEVYDFSPDLAYVMVKRDGRDLLIDAGANKDEIAVLSQDGTDEAIDYIFSPESKNVAYIFFNGQDNPNFFQDYFTYCRVEPIIGGIRLWNLRTRELRTLDTLNVQGMRLLGWLDESSIRYSTPKPQPSEDTLVLP